MTASHAPTTNVRDLAHGRIAWSEAGSGEAIVFLHGIGSAARSFAAQLAGLAPRWRALAWDMPGYGGSSALPGSPDVGAYATSAIEWIDALAVSSFHLVGHSLGSLVAARVAAEQPQRVRTLTLASCAVGHARLSQTERERLLSGRVDDVTALGPRGMAEKRGPRLLGPDATPAAIRAVVETMARVDPHGYAQAARMLSGGDMFADLARLPEALPVQIVYGKADVITPPEINQRVASARAGAHVETIERAGHALYVEQPARFNDIVERFAVKAK